MHISVATCRLRQDSKIRIFAEDAKLSEAQTVFELTYCSVLQGLRLNLLISPPFTTGILKDNRLSWHQKRLGK